MSIVNVLKATKTPQKRKLEQGSCLQEVNNNINNNKSNNKNNKNNNKNYNKNNNKINNKNNNYNYKIIILQSHTLRNLSKCIYIFNFQIQNKKTA